MGGCTMQHHGRVRGFTLIELVAVIVIVAILSGVAAASLGAVQDRRIAFALHETASDVTFARDRALATGCSMWVVFDVGADTYELRRDDMAAPGFANAKTIEDSMTGQLFIRDIRDVHGNAVDLTEANFAGSAIIGFDWMGRPILADGSPLPAAGSIAINVTAKATVAVETGLVTVE